MVGRRRDCGGGGDERHGSIHHPPPPTTTRRRKRRGLGFHSLRVVDFGERFFVAGVDRVGLREARVRRERVGLDHSSWLSLTSLALPLLSLSLSLLFFPNRQLHAPPQPLSLSLRRSGFLLLLLLRLLHGGRRQRGGVGGGGEAVGALHQQRREGAPQEGQGELSFSVPPLPRVSSPLWDRAMSVSDIESPYEQSPLAKLSLDLVLESESLANLL